MHGPAHARECRQTQSCTSGILPAPSRPGAGAEASPASAPPCHLPADRQHDRNALKHLQNLNMGHLYFPFEKQTDIQMTSVLGSSRHPPTAPPTLSPPGGPPPRPGEDSKGALPRCPLPRQVGVGRSGRDTTPRTPRRKRKDQVRTTKGRSATPGASQSGSPQTKQSKENTAGAARQEVQSRTRTHRGVCKRRPLNTKYWNGVMETAMLPGGLQGRKDGLRSRALGGHPGSASGDSASPGPRTTRSRPTAPSSHLGDPS